MVIQEKEKKENQEELACALCGKTPTKYWTVGQLYLCDDCIKEANTNEETMLKLQKQC